uniref:Euchromatic histone-lysine N-methyltransferase 1b n=1 Tax=Nothobranchius rachovii TaxID=451742 RepID=A0A1A8R8U2_9TELE
MASVETEPAGLAVDEVASSEVEGLDPLRDEEEKSDGDKELAARLASPLAAEVMLNGTEGDITTHKNLLTGHNKTVLLVNENGTSDTEPPHGSVTGSNGFLLTMPLQQQEATASLGSGESPHRTNRFPSGSPTGELIAKPVPDSGSVLSSGALRTAPVTGTTLGQGAPDTINGPVPTTAPIAVHRARKTMSRPAVSPAQKLLNKELRQAKSAKLESQVELDVQKSSQLLPVQNHLPQSPPDGPASAQTASPAASTEPGAPSPSPHPTKIQLGPYSAGFSSRKKKRRMGTYSLVPKKKTKVLKQRTVLEMFKELQQQSKSPQRKEMVNVNGEKVGNASEEEEWEDVESSEEERQRRVTEPATALQETSGSTDQCFGSFFLVEANDEQESYDSEEDEGEEEGTESDLSSESSLKKKLKKKTKADSAWLRPPRKRKRRTIHKESEPDVQPHTSAPADEEPQTHVLPPESASIDRTSQSKDSSVSAMEDSQELPLCSCRMETPKSREILILADRKCMATESVDGQLTRCQSAVQKHEMMRPSNSVQLLVLCEDHRSGMVKHQCCPGCGFFCRAGTFMECQPDFSISHRFHRACASMLKGQSFCPHCGDEASKAKEVTIAKADTTSTVPVAAAAHGPAAHGAPEGRADTTTGSSSYLAPVAEDDGGWTAMIWATEYKHVDQVKLLLSRGADISIRDKEENICLHWAAFSGSVEISELLLNAHCSLRAVNVHGDSPLHIAARENRLDSDVFLKNHEGETPPDCCSHNSRAWAVLQANKKDRDAKNIKLSLSEEKLLHSDVSLGQEQVPVPCVNSVDSEPYLEDFKYISENCVTSPMNIDRNITHLQYCVCKEDCSASICMCGQLSLRCWYDKSGCLLPEFCREEPPLIFECNHACSCWRTCKNRVVQNGLRTRLQLFRTSKKGWGVRTLQDIPQGTFVCEYVGEIITESEAELRQNDAYLFSLDDKPEDLYCIDARYYGNISRFLNHMCEPNLFACRVFTTHQDLRFPHIAFFASENIKAGEELGFNYGDHFWEVKSKLFSCECGSSRCKYSSAALASLQADSTPEDQQQPSALPDTSSSNSPS